MKGIIIGGDSASVIVREKSGERISIGELLVAEGSDISYVLQVFDLQHGSQLTQQQLEMVSGLQLEENTDLTLHEPHLRHYVLARAKPVLRIQNGKASAAKTLPVLFGSVRAIVPLDLSFLENPASPLPLGRIRSGSNVIDLCVSLDAEQVLSHHVLVTGTTGRGKSVCMANMFWHLTGKVGLLVFDPHDEYYCGVGRHGLADHPQKQNVVYYTPATPPPGARSLRINISQVEPYHFEGSADWSDAQREALYAAQKEWGERWIEQLLSGKSPLHFKDGTLGVVRRRISQLLHIAPGSGGLDCRGIFDNSQGLTTVADILKDVFAARTVIIDTSEISGGTEVLVASILAGSILDKRKNLAPEELREQPVVSIALEEAPRVLGQDVLQRGPNVFATIAREGRKFRVGLIAVTQLPSLIPRDILANLNTKIILGMELRQERQAIIESAAQDLSQDDRAIAALDRGEAIVTSTFARIALPIRIPSFDETVKFGQPSATRVAVTGMKM